MISRTACADIEGGCTERDDAVLTAAEGEQGPHKE
jgi:hypothetical protein